MDPRLLKIAGDWLKQDKNPTTRREIQDLIDSHNEAELEKLLGSRIQFGTAGLRARMQAGFSRMNDLTVIQASQGLASYLRSQAQSPSIVIGYDHRHNSARFARLTGAVMLHRGVKVYFYGTHVHTPLVPFGVKRLHASAGVMITASHNPAADNGYKVYWANASQIISPHDKRIAEQIEQNFDVDEESWDENAVEKEGEMCVSEGLVERMKTGYFESILGLAGRVNSGGKGVRFVYTPIHGVGLPFMSEAVKQMGIPDDRMHVVPAQASPDPDFSTVRFPNPEERGALDLAIAAANENDIQFILANDPDADRLAAAQKLTDGRWHVFTGNELGILFAAHVLANTSVPRDELTMLCSTVSSQMLASMAAVEGFRFEETLTGFKWLGTRAQDIGPGAVYAFEEALGYMFSSVVPDKDGIAAAAVFLSMLNGPKSEDPYNTLQSLYRKYGFFVSANSYFISPDPKTTRRVFAEIREMEPKKVGEREITWWRDLTKGVDSRDGVPKLPVSKSSEMITVELEKGEVRFTVRGSGTEPKIKIYIECKADSEEIARKTAEEVADCLKREWFRPEKTGLVAQS